MSEHTLSPPESPSSPDLTPDRVIAVHVGLRHWWHANRRDLPWRETRDPYRILVSEVMLQQTQVDRVLPYFERWLEAFPTVQALAEADTGEVIRLWAGLGYNRRAVNLQRTAQAVVERGGEFPRTVEQLQTLPGIGPYTAGAIACFAFEQDAAFIDTNMRRVLHRIFVGVDVPKPLVNDRRMIELAADVIPPGDGWNWNQGLIEFGALHCTARKPLCVVCPVQTSCRARPDIQTMLAETTKAKRDDNKTSVPFTETRRYFRGRIVDSLRDRTAAEGALTLGELGPLVKPDFDESNVTWLLELVQGLERDGLAQIAEDAPVYDVSAPVDEREENEAEGDANVPVDLSALQVRLP